MQLDACRTRRLSGADRHLFAGLRSKQLRELKTFACSSRVILSGQYIPLIVDGKPGDPELECFPPTLKFKLDADGKITDEPSEVQAADAREEGDGEALALAKIVAGLLGVSADEVFRRSERGFRSVKREGRRQARIARIKDGIKFGIEGRPCGRRPRFDRAHQRVGLFRLPKAAAACRHRRVDREIRCDRQRRDIGTRGWPERYRGHQFDQRRGYARTSLCEGAGTAGGR